jgi:spore germination cell wall hydrolase CwlJ-like protein
MKILIGAAAPPPAVFAAQALGGGDVPDAARNGQEQAPALGWSEFARSIGTPAARPPRAAVEQPALVAPDLDVVDAHWMALTMWGEARGDGEAGMRAVGHVIDNRRRLGRHGAFVTDTVSEAWQFSCWNPGDPNLAAMMNVDALPADGREGRMWLAARRLAGEILSGQSEDPTGGSLFYHAVEVAPRWSEGLIPERRIGRHLFFRSAA